MTDTNRQAAELGEHGTDPNDNGPAAEPEEPQEPDAKEPAAEPASEPEG